jgi:3'-5' exoribonuclease
MKEIFIKDLVKDQEITEFFMAKTIAIKVGANGKQYLDIVLCDKTGDITAKKWDVSDAEYPVLKAIEDKTIVKIKGLVTEWAGQLQVRVQRIRVANEQDEQVMNDFVKAAPEEHEAMYDYILSVAENMADEDLKKITKMLLLDNKERLMYYPAAQKNHHAQLGGLLYHMKRMLMTGERICQVYTNLNKDLVASGVIIHDMEKLNEIESGTDGIATGYSFEGQMLGHIIQGIKSIDRIALELEIPREKAIMLEHMILSHHYEPEFGSPKKPLFPEAEVLHYLDILDARMFDMHAALEATQPGEFSDRVFTLDNRKLYKPIEGDKSKC